MVEDSSFFQFVVSDFLIFRYQQPTVLANEGQPSGVFRARTEVLAVAHVRHAI